ncbi:MAG TPA: hypothetical protein VGI66_13805 [Streptosporangiaceae bacterium]
MTLPVRSRIALGVLAMSAVLTLSSAVPAAAGNAAARTGWRVAFSHQYSHIAGYSTVVVPGSRDAWALGGTFTGAGSPIAARWRGRHWYTFALPRAVQGSVIAASAVSSSDIWSVTSNGSVIHWNGKRWYVAKHLPVTTTAWVITGITAFSHGDVWVFGASGYGPGIGTWHQHGRTWTHVTGSGNDIAAGSALSPASIWAINGDSKPVSALMHYNGATWRQVRAKALTGLSFGSVVAITPGDVWALGSGPKPGQHWLLHLARKSWTRVAVPTRPGVPYRIFADGQGGLWAAATNSDGSYRLLHYSRSGRWSNSLTGMYGTGIGDIAVIPGTTSAWGVGAVALKSGTIYPAIWAHGRTG